MKSLSIASLFLCAAIGVQANSAATTLLLLSKPATGPDLHVKQNGNGVLVLDLPVPRDTIAPQGTDWPWLRLPDGTAAAVDADVNHLLPDGMVKVYTTAEWSAKLEPGQLRGKRVEIFYAPLPPDHESGWRDTYMDRSRVERVLACVKCYSGITAKEAELYYFGLPHEFDAASTREQEALFRTLPAKPSFSPAKPEGPLTLHVKLSSEDTDEAKVLTVQSRDLVHGAGRIELGNFYYPAASATQRYTAALDLNCVGADGFGFDIFRLAKAQFGNVAAVELHASNGFTTTITGPDQGLLIAPDKIGLDEGLRHGGLIFLSNAKGYVGWRKFGDLVSENVATVNGITVFLSVP